MRRALFIGLNTYNCGLPNLEGAPANDAQELYRWFCDYGNFDQIDLWPRKKGKEKYDVDANPEGELPKKKLISLISDNFRQPSLTTAFFYFSGHGTQQEVIENEITGKRRSESYLCSSDNKFAIPLSDLHELIKECNVPEKIVWLDCCHSGAILEFDSAFQGMKGLFLASSLTTEDSYQRDGHGIFTQGLIQGIQECLKMHSAVTSTRLISILEDRLRGKIQTFRFGILGDSIELLRQFGVPSDQVIEPTDIFEKLCHHGVEQQVIDNYKQYLRSLRKECARLPLSTINPTPENLLQRIELDQVYLALDVVKARSRQTESDLIDEEAIREPVLRAIAANRFVVLRGAIGSGKSTVVNYLAYHLADATLQEQASKLENKTLDGKILVRLLLNQAIPLILNDGQRGTASLIWQLIERENSCFSNLKEPLRHFGLFLLDGLDEIPETDYRRRRLLEAVEDFAKELGNEARILVTTRPYALSDDDHRSELPSFQTLNLATLSKDQIEELAEKWLHVLKWDEITLENRRQKLNLALHTHPYLADLASQPLLLTLIISLHANYAKLPGNRADIFEAVIDLLLSRWQRGLDEKDEHGVHFLPEGLISVLRTNSNKVKEGLQKLAFQVHEEQRLKGEITAKEVQGLFADFLPDNVNPKSLLRFLNERTGLLTYQTNGQYTFSHRSFQEYLAACYLTDHIDDPATTLVNYVKQDLNWWREVFLLALGKARGGSIPNALNIILTLVPKSPVEIVETLEPDWYWQAAVLGGLGLLELRMVEWVPDKPLNRQIFNIRLADIVVQQVTEWLVKLVEEGKLSPQERARAGNVLGQLGDLRPGVGLDDNNRPDIVWVEIPGGNFTIGTGENQRKKRIDTFYIARYPVTVAQYHAFIVAKGYEEKAFWSSIAWQWRKYKQRTHPTSWEKQKIYRNRPVTGVSWYEAIAFCNWLSQVQKLEIRLPTEEEWEYAARLIPSQSTIAANTEASNIGHPTTVGMYPLAAISQNEESISILDLLGNTWEWCYNVYQEHHTIGKPKLDDLDDEGKRSARGGSWWSSIDTADPTYRKKFEPASSDLDFGFRLIHL